MAPSAISMQPSQSGNRMPRSDRSGAAVDLPALKPPPLAPSPIGSRTPQVCSYQIRVCGEEGPRFVLYLWNSGSNLTLSRAHPCW